MLKDGSYFIDRDPKFFEIILNFLRNNKLEDLSKTELKNLKIEASYFMLENLLIIINERLNNLEVYRFRYWNEQEKQEFNYSVKKSYFKGVPLDVIINFFTEGLTGSFRGYSCKDPFQLFGTHFVISHDDIIHINRPVLENFCWPLNIKEFIEEARNFLMAEMKCKYK